jgi:hypothetical protein
MIAGNAQRVSGVLFVGAVAWMMAGDFALPPDAVAHEGTPRVPAGNVLIVIGGFFLEGRARSWPAASQLRVPRNPLRQIGIWRHVRFAGRAVALNVRFGSKPDAAMVARADHVLAAVARRR